MGLFRSVDRNDDDQYRAYPNREKRKDCKHCGGLGKIIDHVKDRDRFGHVTVTIERTKCRKCRGTGLAL